MMLHTAVSASMAQSDFMGQSRSMELERLPPAYSEVPEEPFQ